ncbi:complex I assembly factor ACAD9, mitochondrial [Calliopsis andreniformis]|uniref:complex I assembly factor ACAD9, mitochondrial n=1 Tax=Calliopsis andreniformis TaxID=337506 RepID=UPI003FCE94B9
MFVRRSSHMKKFLNLNSNYVVKRNSQHEVKFKTLNDRETVFSSHLPKEPRRKPFLKSLLFLEFDNNVLSFPRTQSTDRFKEFFDWLKPIEDYVSSCAGSTNKVDKQEILVNLRNLEVFKAYFNEEYFGLNLSETESLRLIEALSNVPWLGSYIVKNHIIPVQLISKYGSDSQKLEYFPGIASGEVIPTICIKEGDNGTNINNIKSTVKEYEKDSLLLNGKKSYVVNGVDSNLFLVFAHDVSTCNSDQTKYSLLLVEKNFSGVTVTEAYETVGHHEIPLCTVEFNDVILPKRNLLGEPGGAFDIMMELLKPGRQNVAAQAISILRNFINNLTKDVLNTKHFDRNLHEFEFVKKVLGEMVYSLYTMESMTYLTSGLADLYKNQDVELERVITEHYCATKCMTCIQQGLQLQGTQSYMKNNSYLQAFHDALALTTVDTNNINATVYIALTAFQHAGKGNHGYVFRRRNPHLFPLFDLKETCLSILEPKVKIQDHVHPSLSISAEILEHCVSKMKQCILKSFHRYGAEIVDRQIHLMRITDLLTEIYGVTANLSRVSRSYCIGLHNSDHERNMISVLTFGTYNKVMAIYNEVNEGDLFNGDHVYQSTVNAMYEQREYPIEHPLSRIY